MRRFIRDRLIVRVILHGVLLIGVSAVGFLAIALFLLGSGMDRDMRTFATWFGTEACERLARSAHAREEIASFPAAVAVFDANGTRLASSAGEQAIPDLSPADLERAREGRPVLAHPRRLMVVACPDDSRRHAVVGGPTTTLPIGRLGILVAAMVVLIAVGSIPLARSLVRPIRELVSTANRFGKGDLSTRAAVSRADEIGDLALAFNRMASNLQARLMAEKELLANVSHELRTPLARVRVVLETAKEDPARAAASLNEISRDLDDLERLSDDVLATIRLDFSGAADATIRMRPERLDVRSIVRRAIARCVEMYPDREIELEGAEHVPFVEGDPSLLLRLFDNLLENARKYSSAIIRVEVAHEGAVVSVAVSDQGIGIESSDLNRIFDPFFRSDRSRARATGGTGLGLTLCRRIVEVHGGSIHAESQPGVGTTIRVRFPAAAP